MVVGPSGSNIIVFGGIDSNGKYLNDLVSLAMDSTTNNLTWSAIIPEEGSQLPEARAYHSMSVVGDYLVIFGGYSFTKCFDECEFFDTDENVWVRFSDGGSPNAIAGAPGVTITSSASSLLLETPAPGELYVTFLYHLQNNKKFN